MCHILTRQALIENSHLFVHLSWGFPSGANNGHSIGIGKGGAFAEHLMRDLPSVNAVRVVED